MSRITLVIDVESVAVGSFVAVLLALVRVVRGQSVVSEINTGGCGSLVGTEGQGVTIRSAGSNCGALSSWRSVTRRRSLQEKSTYVVDGVGQKVRSSIGSRLRTVTFGLVGAGTVTLVERRASLGCGVCNGRSGSSSGSKAGGGDRVSEGLSEGGRGGTGGSSVDSSDVEAG